MERAELVNSENIPLDGITSPLTSTQISRQERVNAVCRWTYRLRNSPHCVKAKPVMRYTAYTIVVVTFTYLVCWSHSRAVYGQAQGGVEAPAPQQRNPWTQHRVTNQDNSSTVRHHMCIPEQKYTGLSTAIHRLEEELRIVTNLTFINVGNHTIPTSTYEGFTQQLSLIKDILNTIDDVTIERPHLTPMPQFHHVNFTDLLPWLPTWDPNFDLNIKNRTASMRNISLTEEVSENELFKYIEKYHHQDKQFLHMLIESLLNQQQNFENFLDYVEQFTSPSNSQHESGISDEKLEQMELRFEHFASSILQKISGMEEKLQAKAISDNDNARRIKENEEKFKQRQTMKTDSISKAVIKKESVASPTWQDHSLQNANSSLLGIEDKLDVMHEKFINFAKDTEERLEALEDHVPATLGATITMASCNGSQRHQIGSSCYAVPRLTMTGVNGGSGRLYTWWDARYLCKELLGQRADLAVIESEKEMVIIQKMLHNHFGAIEEFWLGASDLDTEGQWTWVDGQHFGPYSNWATPPADSTEQNCVSMLRGYMWSDEPCFYERNPLCELKLE